VRVRESVDYLILVVSNSSSVSVGSFFYFIRYVGYIEVVVEGIVCHVPWCSCDTL
jgi:hypothetical protein